MPGSVTVTFPVLTSLLYVLLWSSQKLTVADPFFSFPTVAE